VGEIRRTGKKRRKTIRRREGEAGLAVGREGKKEEEPKIGKNRKEREKKEEKRVNCVRDGRYRRDEKKKERQRGRVDRAIWRKFGKGTR